MVAMVTAAVTAAAPSIAATIADYAKNADKVDGKHAVGSSASTTARKGKLVATNPETGLLPNSIIAKAQDADKLDGRDSGEFLGKCDLLTLAGYAVIDGANLGDTYADANNSVSCVGGLHAVEVKKTIVGVYRVDFGVNRNGSCNDLVASVTPIGGGDRMATYQMIAEGGPTIFDCVLEVSLYDVSVAGLTDGKVAIALLSRS
jgi:hypothetical protein